MRVLVACEESGRVRDAFRARGHDAISCDILPTAAPGPHIEAPLTPDLLAAGWDLIVAFPPCTKLSNVGARYWPRHQEDGSQQEAFEFVSMIWSAPCGKVAVENPVGWLNTNWNKPTQIINPWQFGDPWRKKTCLWLRGLPALVPEVAEEPEGVGIWIIGQKGAKDPATGERRCFYKTVPAELRGPSMANGGLAGRARARSQTFPGIARAMAAAWG